MKDSIIKYLLGLLLILAGFVVLRTDILYAQSSNTTDSTKTTSLTDKAIEIFTSNTCEFCKELEDELKKTYDSKSFVLKNIDTSSEAKTNFQMALVACNKAQGTVPMFLHQGTCISGKEQILDIFKTVNSANELKGAITADQTKTDIITSTLEDISKIKPTDAIEWYDYAIMGVLLVLFIIGLFLVIRLRKSQNKKFKLFGALVFFFALAGLSAFLWIKVNAVNTLSSTGADAKKNSDNCLDTNSCKDWNEFVKAKAEDAKERGDKNYEEYWEEKVIDQKILDQQIQSQTNALIVAINATPEAREKYCGDKNATCTYAGLINNADSIADSKCGSNDATCYAKEYNNFLYGPNAKDNDASTKNVLDGKYKEAIVEFNQIKLQEAADAYIKNNTINRESLEDYCIQVSGKSLTTGKSVNCTNADALTLVKNFGFESVLVDSYSGLSTYIISQALRKTESTDECTVPTGGGACPAGTQTCECQTSPVARYACGPSGQSCSSICTATHNVCDNCKSITEIPPENPPETPGAPICQESCSANNPCGDGTSCINGKCENPSCVGESDCLCGTDEISCGDGLINNSDQAPEQCELGDPTGTSCSWNSCNQNTCKCPDSNPNWDIEKTSSLVCVNNNTANAYAEVKFNISATYINESSPTTVGVLDRVEDKPVNYLVDWLDPASISNGGTYTTNGNYVEKIIWDLTGALSQFTIPTGETQVTKSDFLSYTFNIPKEYFGSYVNLVTGIPEEGNEFSYTNSVFVACNVPSTALPANTLVKIIIGMFLVGTGLIFAYTQRGDQFALKIADNPIFEKAIFLLSRPEKRVALKKEKFEKDILKDN